MRTSGQSSSGDKPEVRKLQRQLLRAMDRDRLTSFLAHRPTINDLLRVQPHIIEGLFSIPFLRSSSNDFQL